jgi:hypothetical protein
LSDRNLGTLEFGSPAAAKSGSAKVNTKTKG